MVDEKAQRQLQKRIQQIVSSVLLRDIRNSTLQRVNITRVEVTGDLKNATVYWTMWDEAGDAPDEDVEVTTTALKKVTGLMRSELAKTITMRVAPTVRFEYDIRDAQSRSFEELLDAVHLKDKQLADARGATYAGEENPYKSALDEEL